MRIRCAPPSVAFALPSGSSDDSAMPAQVNVDNFARAETDRMFAALAARGGVNQLFHHREPASVDDQPVIRQNRDTLYTSSIVDISEGATLTLPDAGSRYMSVMVVNNDHYINDVFHQGGDYEFTVEQFDTDYVLIAARILADPDDPADLATVHGLQDQMALRAGSARAFTMPDYDQASLDTTRAALLALSRGLPHFDHAFGRKEDVDPVRHLVATASGWGGLPEQEAFYLNVDPGFPPGEHRLTVSDVPVDGFWSISVYNAAGYFEANDRNTYSINNLTAIPNADGSITVNFGGCGDDRPNCVPIPDGWNYTVRLYRPRAEILDGTWTFPTAQPA
jgi:hypothetical protein